MNHTLNTVNVAGGQIVANSLSLPFDFIGKIGSEAIRIAALFYSLRRIFDQAERQKRSDK